MQLANILSRQDFFRKFQPDLFLEEEIDGKHQEYKADDLGPPERLVLEHYKRQ